MPRRRRLVTIRRPTSLNLAYHRPMAARKSKRSSRKPTRRGTKPQKLTRLGLPVPLTRSEV